MDRTQLNNSYEMARAGFVDYCIRVGVEENGLLSILHEGDFGHNSKLLVSDRNKRVREYPLRIGKTDTFDGFDILEKMNEKEAIKWIVDDFHSRPVGLEI